MDILLCCMRTHSHKIVTFNTSKHATKMKGHTMGVVFLSLPLTRHADPLTQSPSSLYGYIDYPVLQRPASIFSLAIIIRHHCHVRRRHFFPLIPCLPRVVLTALTTIKRREQFLCWEKLSCVARGLEPGCNELLITATRFQGV